MFKPDLVTFDVYMALLDIQGGLRAAFAKATGVEDDVATSLVSLWRAKQMERAASSNSLGREHTAFRDCTALALDYVCARHQLSLEHEVRRQLIDAWNSLKPWPEADESLKRIKAKGYAIAILSNGDQSMLDAVAAQFSVPFDHVLSAQTAGRYKPHPAVYELPMRQLGIARERTLHVAGSANDVLGAVCFGMPCVWSNRANEPLVDPAFPPARQTADLAGVPDLLKS